MIVLKEKLMLLLPPQPPHLAFRTAFILHGNDSTRCWTHSWDFIPYWRDGTVQSLHICQRYWNEIWWLWSPFQYSEWTVVLKKPVWDHLCLMTWCIILLEELPRNCPPHHHTPSTNSLKHWYKAGWCFAAVAHLLQGFDVLCIQIFCIAWLQWVAT